MYFRIIQICILNFSVYARIYVRTWASVVEAIKYLHAGVRCLQRARMW